MTTSGTFPLDAASRTYKRLRPRLESHFAAFATQNPGAWQEFLSRLDQHFSRLFDLLIQLYGNNYDFY